MAEPSMEKIDNTAQQLDERLLELSALFEISRSLTSSLSIRSILENILRIPMGHMLITRGLVLLRHEGEQEYVLEELKGLPRHLLGKNLHIDQLPVRSQLIGEVQDQPDWLDFFREFNIELLLPLETSQGAMGLVGFGCKIGNKPFTESEVEFLDSISNIAATAVANGLNMDEIQKVNRNLDRKIQQLNTIFDISRELNTTLDRGKIASLLSFAVMGELLVNRCAVYTRENGEMQLLMSKGVTGLPKSDDNICSLAAPTHLDDSIRFKPYWDAGIEVMVPMLMQDEIKGILAVGKKISGGAFSEAELEFLKTLGNQAVAALENARLFEETLEKQRMEEELNLARNMQRALLPETLPQPEGVEIAAVNISSRQVGGDYYDVIPISETRYGIAIADVSGKGAGAALLMSNLQAGLQALATGDDDLPTMVGRINNLIHRNTGLDKFITFFYGILDTEHRTFTFCNAGHNPPYRFNASNSIDELMTGGIILGMMPDMPYEMETISLCPGDRLVLYTDGITEAMDLDEEEYGEDRLQDAVKSRPEMTAQALMDGIGEEVRAFTGTAPQSDDITMLVLRIVT